MSGKESWQEARHELEEARVAADAEWKAWQRLVGDRKISARRFRAATRKHDAAVIRVHQLELIELNLRRILRIQEMPAPKARQ